MTGLRERKKQRTRDALIRAAHELFVTQGYDATTVDQIAEAVDVSQRTFFRYFTNKEEVALSLHETINDRFYASLCARPVDEPPLQSLRRAVDEVWDESSRTITEILPVELHMQLCQVIETTPSLLSAHLHHYLLLEEKLVQEIARRTGLDDEQDPRPRVLVAAFAGVMRSAARHWGMRGDASLEEARRSTHAFLDELRPALASEWGRGTRVAERDE
ncbi:MULTISPECIES: TetR family transcriptional regulator [Streptomyces]|uniref:TetR family transcriptional regulator n=1 Tax=Streptomyces cacaoi TaxID=1898 RepID=A0A4Y3QYF3_STRCI|nr:MULTISPECIES: TetR family transcriptional regulator [Streptomyces]NNG84698.1 TetR family transcriptional regulator [Streptomyces cacaoi]GEB50281.1 TetR family transcriptional regulator [Streptomyces cacaoi]